MLGWVAVHWGGLVTGWVPPCIAELVSLAYNQVHESLIQGMPKQEPGLLVNKD